MAKKISPELREKIRRTNEDGAKARAIMQDVLDRSFERQRLRDERATLKRPSLFRRLLPF
jgi:hypothetical protein